MGLYFLGEFQEIKTGLLKVTSNSYAQARFIFVYMF